MANKAKKDSLVIYSGDSFSIQNKGCELGFLEEIVFKGTFDECRKWKEKNSNLPGININSSRHNILS